VDTAVSKCTGNKLATVVDGTQISLGQGSNMPTQQGEWKEMAGL